MKAINRICISRMKFIGDIVLTTPVIHAVRDAYPEAHIAYLGEKEAVSLLRHNPHLDEIISFDFSVPTIIEQPRVGMKLRKKSFDVFIDFFNNPRTAILARMSGARIRVGKEVKGRGMLYTERILDDGKPKSAIAYHYQYVKPIGVEPKYWKTEIYLTGEEHREARTYLKWQDVDLSRPIVGIHPGATWPAKIWPWENFADLADLIRAKLDSQVVVVQGPNDQDLITNITRRSAGQVTVLPLMKLRQLAAVISCFSTFISNDNGAMHIAAACGTKTIGIFGPGEENIWFPYLPPYYDATAGHIALRRDVPCHPCHLDFCNRQGDEYMECMRLLSVGEVLEEVKKRM